MGAVPLVRGQPVGKKEHLPVPWRAGAKANVLGRVGGRFFLAYVYTLVTGLVAWASYFPFAGLGFPNHQTRGLDVVGNFQTVSL